MTSIVVVARAASRPVMHSLAGMESLAERARLEVIVVNHGVNQGGPAHFPAARVVDVPATLTLAQARHAGVERSTGDIVAIVDERYRVSDAWLAVMEEAHAHDVDVVSGPVTPSPTLTNQQWAMYLTEYSHLAGPFDPVRIPGGNASYKRRAFQLASMRNAASELDFHQALLGAGARFVHSQKMSAEFASPPSLDEYLAERRQVSRDFASFRARDSGRVARGMAATARLALPPLLLSRYAARSLARRDFRARFWPALPWIARFTFVQMVAEMEGILSST
jgi:hypothetical protein